MEQISLDQLDSRVKELEMFAESACGIAHDLNNLLTVICAYADPLAWKKKVSTIADEELNLIRECGHRAAALTRELSHRGANGDHSSCPLDLNRLVREDLKIIRGIVGQSIIVSTDLQDTLGMVAAEQTKLERVLFNLARNSADAMPNGGKLLIKTRMVYRRWNQNSSTNSSGTVPVPLVRLDICDTGIGMSSESCHRAFDAGYTTKSAGRGLGLSNSFRIVNDLGGQIWFQSEPNVGTTFSILLNSTDDEREMSHVLSPTGDCCIKTN